MGQLFNRSQMHKLEGLMTHHVNTFVQILASMKDEVNLTPACRALEADIICKQVVSCICGLGIFLNNLAADFSFGHTIGALKSFSSGTELAMVAKNDEKATWMPLVCGWFIIVDLIPTHTSIVDKLPTFLRNWGAA